MAAAPPPSMRTWKVAGGTAGTASAKVPSARVETDSIGRGAGSPRAMRRASSSGDSKGTALTVTPGAGRSARRRRPRISRAPLSAGSASAPIPAAMARTTGARRIRLTDLLLLSTVLLLVLAQLGQHGEVL